MFPYTSLGRIGQDLLGILSDIFVQDKFKIVDFENCSKLCLTCNWLDSGSQRLEREIKFYRLPIYRP